MERSEPSGPTGKARPPTRRPRTTQRQALHARELINRGGLSARQVAKSSGVSRGSVLAMMRGATMRVEREGDTPRRAAPPPDCSGLGCGECVRCLAGAYTGPPADGPTADFPAEGAAGKAYLPTPEEIAARAAEIRAAAPRRNLYEAAADPGPVETRRVGVPEGLRSALRAPVTEDDPQR